MISFTSTRSPHPGPPEANSGEIYLIDSLDRRDVFGRTAADEERGQRLLSDVFAHGKELLRQQRAPPTASPYVPRSLPDGTTSAAGGAFHPSKT